MALTTYPVHVDAHLDPEVSRGLWLVKWVLAIPHYVVLAFLWVAFVVSSVVAFVAILVTGRYPRAIFELNVGVLRWSWRVGYYAYGALGTDRYPPFSLAERPDYPAHLEIDYPEHLSRGLVLVKWWLLAIPHYLVLGILLGGGVTLAADADTGDAWFAGTGLIGLLVLVAAIVLLVTGRYPQPLFDLVLGLNRWVLRVAAYAGLMTDQYPPFRLDQGGHESGSGCMVVPSGPAAPEAPAAPAAVKAPAPPTAVAAGPTEGSARWTAGHVVAMVAASLLLLASLCIAGAGGVAAWADGVVRDDAGYVMSGHETLTTDTYAITSAPLVVADDGAGGSADADWVPERLIGTARISALAPAGSELFLGVARSADVDSYLAGVAHDELTEVDRVTGAAYRASAGGSPRVAPGDADIWRASSTGTGEVVLTWPVEDGEWTVVAMDADGARGVSADVAAGATLPVLDWLGPLLLVIGAVGLGLGVLALVLVIRSASRPTSPRIAS